MSAKVLSQMTREEIIDGAVKALVKLFKKQHCVFNFHVFLSGDKTAATLLALVFNTEILDQQNAMATLAIVDKALAWYRLPVWWDADRVSVNGCNASFQDFDNDTSRAKLWATLKALSLHCT